MGILQHGTLPLYGDLTRILDVLHILDTDKGELELRQRILDRAKTVENAVGRKIKWEEVAEQFIRAFEETLNLSFVRSEPSEEELERTKTLIKEKYSSADWTNRI